MTHRQRIAVNKQSIRNDPKMAHILDLIDKDFKAVILDVIRELKKNTFKELKQI